jgi:hypothetical protein
MASALKFIIDNAPAFSAIIAAFSAIIGALVFALAVFSYTKQNALRRFEAFQKMRQLAREDPAIIEVVNCLRDKDPKLANLERRKKYRFLSFYEEIAFMHESRLIRTTVAHYMFGFFCVQCLQNSAFWENIKDDKDSYYWSLFIRFATLMQEVEKEKLREHASLSNTEKPTSPLSRRPSFVFWRDQSQFRF